MVGGGFHLGFLHSKGSSHASHVHVFIFGLIFVSYGTHVQASTSVSCRSPNISSKYQHCGIHPDGVHDLDCFGKHKPSGMKTCVWKPGKRPSEKTYTLIIQQQLKRGIYCNVYDNITEFSENIKLYENYNVVAEVFENSQRSTNCTKAVFDGSPKSLLRCGPPYKVSFSRHSGRLVVNVSWPREDLKFIKYYFVSYKALGSMSWNKSVRSQNATTCTVGHLNSSLGYTAQIQCVTSDKCPQCAVSEAYTVPPELTTRPLIVKFEETDIRGRKGFRLLSLTWKFSGKEPHDGYAVSVGKASGEAPCERISTTQPEITLILSYSAYRLDIRAVNDVSTSPAVSRAIPRREDGVGDGKMNVTVHSNTSFTVYWRDNLIRHYVCYSVEWMKKGQEATHMSFYQNTHNYRTLSLVREPLEPYKRYSITLHTRPNKDTCNMKRVNNSESTYGRTQFYSTEGHVVMFHREDVDLLMALVRRNSPEIATFMLGYFTLTFIDLLVALEEQSVDQANGIHPLGTMHISPVSAPTNISSSNVTLHSVALQWSSIPEEDIRGFLLGYTIYYNEYHHGRSSTERNITVDPMRNRYELGHLKGGTAYEVQISGFNRAGAGVRSTASLFKTNDQGFSNLTGFIIISAVVATVLIFGHPIIKRAKVMLWPSIPNPGKSNAMQNIEEPCELELMESLNTPRVEEWDTSSLQVVEKEDAMPSSASPSTLSLLGASEESEDSESRNWIQRDPEDATGDIPPYSTEETFSDIRRTDNQSCPLAFSGDYTTLDMFQQANTSVTQTTGSKPEEPDSTVAKSGLDYIGQYGTGKTTEGPKDQHPYVFRL